MSLRSAWFTERVPGTVRTVKKDHVSERKDGGREDLGLLR